MALARGFGVWGLGFRAWGLGFSVAGLGVWTLASGISAPRAFGLGVGLRRCAAYHARHGAEVPSLPRLADHG